LEHFKDEKILVEELKKEISLQQGNNIKKWENPYGSEATSEKEGHFFIKREGEAEIKAS
jgi:hypothetical protein